MRRYIIPALIALFVATGFVFATGQAPHPSNSPKIDNEAVNGLAGVSNSLAYKVHGIEKHFHNSELWYGAAAGDGYFDTTVLTEFQVTASNTGFDGTELQISNGDEIELGDATKYYDIHEILVTATSAANKVQKIQFLYGTGAVGAATVASEIGFFVPAAGKSAAIEMIMPRITCNNKVWVKAFSETNSATIDFIIGIHTYPG